MDNKIKTRRISNLQAQMNGQNFTYSTTGDLEKLAFFSGEGLEKRATAIFFGYNLNPYGKILRKYVPGNGIERYLTTQHERDKETISENNDGTGLDYRIGRYYDSDIARFTTIDPKDYLFPEYSPYNYVLGNPVMLTDPDGECPTCLVGGLIGLGVGLYDLSQQYGSFSNAMGQLMDGNTKALSHLAITTGTGVALGSGVGIIGAAGISGGANLLDQTIQNDGDMSKISGTQVATATVLGGLGNGAGKVVNNMVTKSVTYKASALNPFVEKTVNNSNNIAKVVGAEAGVVLSTTAAEKITNAITTEGTSTNGTNYTPSPLIQPTETESSFGFPVNF